MFGRSARIETKTPEQILRMRRAGLVVGQTLQLMAQTVRPGITTKQLDELAEEHIRGCGAVPSFLGYHGFTGTLCTSVNDEVVHGIPGARVLAEGDVISIDCGAIVDGWHGDAAISVVVGGREAGRPEDLALIDATEDAMWAGIAALGAGESLYAVGAAVEDSVTEAGERDQRDYGIVEDYVGHGIGTEMHQDPQVPNYRVRDKGVKVRSGLVVAVEPMLTRGSAQTRVLADDWTVATLDGSRAAHFEHTVAVSDEGLWVLTALDGGEQQLTALGAPFAPLT
jgi:methionyl aminopeptidase